MLSTLAGASTRAEPRPAVAETALVRSTGSCLHSGTQAVGAGRGVFNVAQHEIAISIDFDGAAATRSEILQILQGQLDDDILHALQQPGTPDWLLALPFQVVECLEELKGPADGSDASLPIPWRTPARGRDGERADRVDLYRQVLMHGTADDQRMALAAGLLVAQWTAIRAGVPTAIAQVWEQRFPELDPRW